MLKKLLITFLLHVNFVRCYTNSMVIPDHCIIRRTIIYDTKMPTLYTRFNFNVNCLDKNKFLTAEHVYPQSLLNEKQSKDMHNIIKTLNTLNVNRSNYKYCDYIDLNDKNWKHLEHNNYVNHKRKLFVPNSESRGFISRAILYMCKEYNFKFTNIIEKPTLIKWYYTYCPTTDEIYHNAMVRYIQKNNNIFISAYNKKNMAIKKYIEKL
jgi:hypothetical protein